MQDGLAPLATAYADAHYFVTIGRREWLFQVGQPALEIERQLQAGTYLFITAWNPHGRPAADGHNAEADEALQARLLELDWPHHPALGCDASGGAVERGWLVLDAPLEAADGLAREFLQAGTVFWERGHAVGLRMLHPAPAEGEGPAHTVWVG